MTNYVFGKMYVQKDGSAAVCTCTAPNTGAKFRDACDFQVKERDIVGEWQDEKPKRKYIYYCYDSGHQLVWIMKNRVCLPGHYRRIPSLDKIVEVPE